VRDRQEGPVFVGEAHQFGCGFRVLGQRLLAHHRDAGRKEAAGDLEMAVVGRGIGALSAADERGLSVPDDLSLVGYDNTYLAKIRHLSLTSVDNGNFAVGLQAGKFILERREHPELPQRLHPVATQLVVRGSTGHAPAG
jgi:hypothetical protein